MLFVTVCALISLVQCTARSDGGEKGVKEAGKPDVGNQLGGTNEESGHQLQDNTNGGPSVEDCLSQLDQLRKQTQCAVSEAFDSMTEHAKKHIPQLRSSGTADAKEPSADNQSQDETEKELSYENFKRMVDQLRNAVREKIDSGAEELKKAILQPRRPERRASQSDTGNTPHQNSLEGGKMRQRAYSN